MVNPDLNSQKKQSCHHAAKQHAKKFSDLDLPTEKAGLMSPEKATLPTEKEVVLKLAKSLAIV